MTMNNELMQAILSMDSYNRDYDQPNRGILWAGSLLIQLNPITHKDS